MDESGPRVSVRGIYATALTERLRDEYQVVTPSPVIRNRFSTDFPDREPTVTIADTQDRQGVLVSGDDAAVDAIGSTLAAVAVDGFRWEATVPEGAVVDAVVTETTGGGAIFDLGGVEGYLPFDAVDDHVTVGDIRRVQVQTPAAPWVSRRHELRVDIAVDGAIASLVRGVDAAVAGTPAEGEELARTTEILDVALPDRWGVRWEAPAVDTDFDGLATALERGVSRANAVESAVGDRPVPEDTDAVPAVVATPASTQWVRFGRDGRFALDEDRATVIATIAGHHRIKAGGETASGGVEFAERLGATVESFPFAAVTGAFGPRDGDRVRIVHGKPDGREYDLGRGEVTGRDTEASTVRVEREVHSDGTYDGLEVPKAAGDVAVSTFREGRWWYPTTYRSSDGELRGTYLNVNTPVEIYPDAVRYVDLHVDIVKWPDGSVAIVDEEELDTAIAAGSVTEDLGERAFEVAESVASAVRSDESG